MSIDLYLFILLVKRVHVHSTTLLYIYQNIIVIHFNKLKYFVYAQHTCTTDARIIPLPWIHLCACCAILRNAFNLMKLFFFLSYSKINILLFVPNKVSFFLFVVFIISIYFICSLSICTAILFYFACGRHVLYILYIHIIALDCLVC